MWFVGMAGPARLGENVTSPKPISSDDLLRVAARQLHRLYWLLARGFYVTSCFGWNVDTSAGRSLPASQEIAGIRLWISFTTASASLDDLLGG